MSNKAANKKQKLLARKQELLNELKYYERRIAEARASNNKRICSYEADSSDSEIEFHIDVGPSLSELKQQKARLKMCLLATQELTELTVVQSEVNLLVDPPIYDNEPVISEEGSWREVMAECRVDLVPFTISFYTHQPNRQFAPTSFRGLSVMPTKLSHEKELQQSVLPSLTTPSDAIEVLRSYAAEYRARRTTLARLADKYGDCLFMEQAPEGGFAVRCADLLNMSWVLQNPQSPCARFRHKMKFDLEYMEERYVKTISQAYQALGDPALDADGRTLLLAKIIDTCLEAKGLMDAQRQASDQDSDVARSGQIMGPPKSLPKKTKRKDKENVANDDVNTERNTTGENSQAKKGKTDAKKANSKRNVDNIDINENTKTSNQVMLGEGGGVGGWGGGVGGGTAKKLTRNKQNRSGREEVTESAKVTKNEIEDWNKNNLNSEDIEELNKTETIKAKKSVHTEKDPKSSLSLVGAKNEKNTDILKTNENIKVSEKELKSKDGFKKVASKLISTEKETISFQNDANKDLNCKTVAKTLKTKAVASENEPKAKKSKMSVANINRNAAPANTENIAKRKTNTMTEPKNKQNIVKEKAVTEKNLKKNLNKIVQSQATKIGKEKNAKQNLIPEKLQPNPQDVNNGIKKPENIKFSKLNTKDSLKKTSNTNSKLNIVQKSNNVPTLSDRFRNKINTNDIESMSLGMKKAVSKNVVGKKIVSKIPLKKTYHKNVMTFPLRMSPRLLKKPTLK